MTQFEKTLYPVSFPTFQIGDHVSAKMFTMAYLKNPRYIYKNVHETESFLF